jgi:hypothetical protein
MPDPITTGSLLVAASWAGKKILGPSLDELGSQLKIFAGNRIEKIFFKVESVAADDQSLNQIPPAFALKFFQAASLSEDDELITELWANLLVNASKDFTQRKVLYLDILEKLSADDAKILDQLTNPLPDDLKTHSVRWQLENIRMRGVFAAERILRVRGLTHFDGDAADEFNDEMENINHPWPAKILGSIVPYTPLVVEGSGSPSSSASGLANSNAPYDALVRQRLIQTFEISFISGFTIELEGVMATALGVEFIRNCRGVTR